AILIEVFSQANSLRYEQHERTSHCTSRRTPRRPSTKRFRAEARTSRWLGAPRIHFLTARAFRLCAKGAEGWARDSDLDRRRRRLSRGRVRYAVRSEDD